MDKKKKEGEILDLSFRLWLEVWMIVFQCYVEEKWTEVVLLWRFDEGAKMIVYSVVGFSMVGRFRR